LLSLSLPVGGIAEGGAIGVAGGVIGSGRASSFSGFSGWSRS
jgi:hypothetical protein